MGCQEDQQCTHSESLHFGYSYLSSSAFSLFGGRHIKFSISTFSGLVLLLSLLVSPSCLFYSIAPPQFFVPIFRCPLNSMCLPRTVTSSNVHVSRECARTTASVISEAAEYCNQYVLSNN